MSPAKTSHPARGAWIEMFWFSGEREVNRRSHPARGAWIEITAAPTGYDAGQVAPRKGCVD